MAIVGAFPKQPSEKFAVDIDYTGKLPSGASIASGTVAAIDMSDGSNISATLLDSVTAVVSGNKVIATVKAGSDAKDYKITFTTTLDTGTIIEDELVCLSRET